VLRVIAANFPGDLYAPMALSAMVGTESRRTSAKNASQPPVRAWQHVSATRLGGRVVSRWDAAGWQGPVLRLRRRQPWPSATGLRPEAS
jgi:hypothetical protein